jgi:glutamyl-tRNA synthetase
MAEASLYFYKEFEAYEEKAAKKNLTPEAALVLQGLHERFAQVGAWRSDELHQIVQAFAEDRQLNLGKVAQPLRVAVMGSSVSPAIDATLTLLGKQKTLARIERAVAYIKTLN